PHCALQQPRHVDRIARVQRYRVLCVTPDLGCVFKYDHAVVGALAHHVVDDSIDERCLAYSAAIRMRRRIASRQLLPNCWSLPHLICSRHLRVRSKSDEAYQRGNKERVDYGFSATVL